MLPVTRKLANTQVGENNGSTSLVGNFLSLQNCFCPVKIKAVTFCFVLL